MGSNGISRGIRQSLEEVSLEFKVNASVSVHWPPIVLCSSRNKQTISSSSRHQRGVMNHECASYPRELPELYGVNPSGQLISVHPFMIFSVLGASPPQVT